MKLTTQSEKPLELVNDRDALYTLKKDCKKEIRQMEYAVAQLDVKIKALDELIEIESKKYYDWVGAMFKLGAYLVANPDREVLKTYGRRATIEEKTKNLKWFHETFKDVWTFFEYVKKADPEKRQYVCEQSMMFNQSQIVDFITIITNP